MNELSVHILTIIIGTGGISSVLVYLGTRKKLRAETDSLIAISYRDLVDNLQEEVKALRVQMNEFSKRENNLNQRIFELEKENKELIAKINTLNEK